MSLSRRYRPQVFADITGQEPIKETLRKEVATGKLGHAYLFSGPRGVGKTTTARIFAKALNCLQLKDGEPCNKCEMCRDANDGRLLDVIEMDAASNTGVDNVREAIVEHVRFAPSRGKRKVYILDEAHMLSPSAWNALLKTLEEPPEYAVFILATTEFHKVPATIVSRCQRFDFKRIPVDALEQRLQQLAKTEGVSIDKTVLDSVARHADGCVRDAETLLGQLMSLGEKKITEAVASLVLPVSRLPVAASLLETCASRQLGASLAAVAKLEEDGIPLLPIFDDMIAAVRMLLLAADDSETAKRLASGEEGEKAVSKLVGIFPPQELNKIALLLMERRRDAKQGIDPRFAMELAISTIALGLLVQEASAGLQRPPEPPKPPTPLASPQPTPAQPKAAIEEVAHVAPPPPKKATPSAPSSFTLADVQRKWSAFISTISEKNASLSYILSTCRPELVEGVTLTIRYQYAFHRDKIMNDGKNRRLIEDALRDMLASQDLLLESVVGEDGPAKTKRSEDMVSNILKAFGGQMVDGNAESN